MPKNPLALLPAKYRLTAYAILGLATVALGAYQAADGDWVKAITYFLGTLGFGTAASNVSLEPRASAAPAPVADAPDAPPAA